MTEQQLMNAIELISVLGLYSVLFFKILPTYRLDSFRQRMFAVRDEVFDFAAKGNIAFDDPAYVLLRRQMNGLIRYGHHLTVFRMLMTFILQKMEVGNASPNWTEQWNAALLKIGDHDVQEKMRVFYSRSIYIAVRHLVSGSPLLCFAILAVVLAMVPGLLCRNAALGAKQLLHSAVSKVLVGPLDRRRIEEAAAAA
jgi:hypothetical protein